MTRAISSLRAVASEYDAIVLDQWGVLHDGTTPYPGAVAALQRLKAEGHRLAVLSNSGKRAAPNAKRIASMGFPETLFDVVMTSGEALWVDIQAGRVPERCFLPIERAPGDAALWAEGLELTLVNAADEAEAILLMGLPDEGDPTAAQHVLDHASAQGLTVYCSNPDKASPRAGGQTVVSPGALAHAHRDNGGHVIFYGKPHRAIFQALETALNTGKLLMVGDSLEHDIAGAHGAGWDSLLIQDGLYQADFQNADGDAALARLMAEKSAPAPTYRTEVLQ